ncbi:MAG: GIY-YIG nuclease family protein [Gemmatimonadetes bacterium]|nr:GIY-YIG nuclease family protein [Gemmatimonadota bacterium]MCY3942161.1 GIY-YIG nuclease family protein [Gemmatimonadota bacterium]
MTATALGKLREKVREGAEERPGVYRWYGADGRVLYVGKSVSLRSRLLSYFRERTGKAARIVAKAADVSWECKPNEFAALVGEMRLIRTWQPEYNVQHRRDRSYGFVKVTKESAPRLLPVESIANDGAAYYGPFPRTAWLARAVGELALATGLRNCPARTSIHFDDQLEIFSDTKIPRCIRAETRSCLGPCAGRCTGAEYRRGVRLAQAFLGARSQRPLGELAEAARRAARRLDFEYAARLHERIETLRRLQGYLAGFRGQIEKLNLVYPVSGFAGDSRLYLIRRGVLAAELPAPRSAPARDRARKAVRELFQPVAADRDGTLDGDAAAEALLTVAWFNRHPQEWERAQTPRQWLERG